MATSRTARAHAAPAISLKPLTLSDLSLVRGGTGSPGTGKTLTAALLGK